jgi:hypothetical protein
VWRGGPDVEEHWQVSALRCWDGTPLDVVYAIDVLRGATAFRDSTPSTPAGP